MNSKNKSNEAMTSNALKGNCARCAILLEILRMLKIKVTIPPSCGDAPEVGIIEGLLTRKEVIHKLNISESTYTRWIADGILVPREIGRRHFFTDTDLERAFRESVRKGKR